MFSSYQPRQILAIVLPIFSLIAWNNTVELLAAENEIRAENVSVKPIKTVDVPARQAESISSILVKVGRLVKKKDLLARLDDSEAKLEQKRATIEQTVAKRKADDLSKEKEAELKSNLAISQLERALAADRLNPGSVKASDLDKLRFTAKHEKLELTIARMEQKITSDQLDLADTVLELAKEQVKKHQIISPIDGMVVQIYHEQGEWVEPGKSIITLVKLDQLRVDAFVRITKNTGRLSGRKVQLLATTAIGKTITLHGKITFVNPVLQGRDKNMLIVRAEVDNPNMFVKPGVRAVLIIK